MRTNILWLAILLAPWLGASPARAEDPVAVANQWGLIGTWKINCAMPASRDDMREIYRVVGGQLVEFRDFGDIQDQNPVRSASIDKDGELVLAIEFPKVKGQIRENVLVKTASAKRTVENHLLDRSGETVHNGMLVFSGQPTPWFQRCEGKDGSRRVSRDPATRNS